MIPAVNEPGKPTPLLSTLHAVNTVGSQLASGKTQRRHRGQGYAGALRARKLPASLHLSRSFACAYGTSRCLVGSKQGLQPKTVQTFVGHATLQMTMNTYGHMLPSEDHAKAMDRLPRGYSLRTRVGEEHRE
jgi:integrase